MQEPVGSGKAADDNEVRMEIGRKRSSHFGENFAGGNGSLAGCHGAGRLAMRASRNPVAW